MVLPWKGLTLTWSTGWDLVCTSCTFLTYSIEETSPHFCTCLQRATWDFDLWYVPATRLHTSGHPILICFQLSGFHKYLLPWAILQCGHNMFHSRYGERGIMANGYPQLTHTLLKAIPSLLFSLGLFSFTWSLYCSNAWLYGPPNYHPAICWLWLQRPQVHIHAFFYRFCIQFIHSLGGFWAINCWFWVTSVFDKWTCFWRVSSRIPLLLLTNKKKDCCDFYWCGAHHYETRGSVCWFYWSYFQSWFSLHLMNQLFSFSFFTEIGNTRTNFLPSPRAY